jgi:hypothetical protein
MKVAQDHGCALNYVSVRFSSSRMKSLEGSGGMGATLRRAME